MSAVAPQKSDVWEGCTVDVEVVVKDADFSARHGSLERSHVRTLVMAIRNSGALTPILLWRDVSRGDEGRLTLLDGAYRLAAYKSAKWKGGIPARVISCDRRRAMLIAAGANSRDTLPLSYGEKADLAWRLVREPAAGYSKAEIARATSVSTRTVATMRSRWREMIGAGGLATGEWWRDQKSVTPEGAGPMTDAERAALVKVMAEEMRKAAGSQTLQDETLVADALEAAFGYRLRAMADYLYGDMDEWAGIAVQDDDSDLEGEENLDF